MTPKMATDKVNAPAVSQLAGEIAEPHFGRLIDAKRLSALAPMIGGGKPLAYRPKWSHGEYARVDGEGPVIDGALVREWIRADYLFKIGQEDDWELWGLTKKGRNWATAAQEFVKQEKLRAALSALGESK